MSGIGVPSLLAGAAVAMLTADVLPFMKSLNTAPALMERRNFTVLARVVQFIEKVRGLGSKGTGEAWEQICYSLAFHLRAGETAAQAVRGTAAEGDSAAHTLLMKVAQSYDAGTGLQAALESRSSQSDELQQVASTLEMGSATGANTPLLLCHTAEVLRRRRLDRGELRAKLAEARATAILLSLLPWAIGYFTLLQDARAGVSVLRDPRGRVLLAISGLLWVIGNVLVVYLLRTLLPPRKSRRRRSEGCLQ